MLCSQSIERCIYITGWPHLVHIVIAESVFQCIVYLPGYFSDGDVTSSSCDSRAPLTNNNAINLFVCYSGTDTRPSTRTLVCRRAHANTHKHIKRLNREKHMGLRRDLQSQKPPDNLPFQWEQCPYVLSFIYSPVCWDCLSHMSLWLTCLMYYTLTPFTVQPNIQTNCGWMMINHTVNVHPQRLSLSVQKIFALPLFFYVTLSPSVFPHTQEELHTYTVVSVKIDCSQLLQERLTRTPVGLHGCV